MFLIWAVLACLTAADLPEDLAKLAETARGAPAELAADLLIRLSELPRVRARGAKRELLKEAFELAKGARHPVALVALGGGVRERGLADGLAMGLSRVGLQARVVRRMIAVDPVWAERLFEAMGRPVGEAVDCGAATAPVLAEYFQTLRDLVRRGGAGFATINTEARAMESPQALEPLAELIRDGNWTQIQLEELADGYARKLGQMDAGALEFQRAAGYGLQQRIFELTRRLVKAGISPRPLMEAWRRFLVRHLTGLRCAAAGNFGVRMVAAFNESLRELGHSREAVAPISAEESKAAGVVAARAAVGERDGWEGLLSADPAGYVARLKGLVQTDAVEWRRRLEPLLRVEHLEQVKASGDALMVAYAESAR